MFQGLVILLFLFMRLLSMYLEGNFGWATALLVPWLKDVLKPKAQEVSTAKEGLLWSSSCVLSTAPKLI